MDLVYVEFYDHRSQGDEWTDLEEADTDLEPLLCRSVGWVVAENGTLLRLMANLDGPDGKANFAFGCFDILKAAIVKRKRLAIPR